MGTTGQSVTLANSIIGVGILAMPFCFQQCGVLLATLILLLMGLVSRLCCYFLLKSALIARRRNFEFLAFHVFGPASKLAVEVGIIGFLMGTCIAYFVVVGDLGPQIIAKMFNINQSDILRTTIMVLVSLVCVLPLGLLRNVDSLSNVSAATIGFYFCLVLKVLAEAASQLLTGDWHTRLEMWKPSGMLQCVPIFSMALFCQTQLFEIFESLPSLSLEKMNVVTKNAINICTGVYFTLGLFGYIAFCSHEISGNILMSLSPTMANDVIKLGFVMSLAFSFPLIIFPCRASLYSFLFKKVQHTYHDHIVNNSIPETTFRCITVAIIAVALFISLLIPNIELVLGLVGSTIGVMVCVIFPAACFINITFKNTNERILAKGVVVLGLIILVLGTYANLQAAEKLERYDDKFITQERIDKIVEDFFEKSEKDNKDVIAKPDKSEPVKDKVNKLVELKDSEVQPPNPVPPESQSNEKNKNIIIDVKEVNKLKEVPNVEKEVDKASESHPKNLKTKLQEAKLANGGSNKNNVNEKPIKEKVKPPTSEEKNDIIKQQKLMETIKQHGEEQKELIKEQKEILHEIMKTKNEIQQNKKEINSNEAKKIAVESIQKIANMAIQSLSGVSEKPVLNDVENKAKPLEKIANEAVQEIAKKAVETIEAIKDLKEQPKELPKPDNNKDINEGNVQVNNVANLVPAQNNNENNQNVPVVPNPQVEKQNPPFAPQVPIVNNPQVPSAQIANNLVLNNNNQVNANIPSVENLNAQMNTNIAVPNQQVQNSINSPQKPAVNNVNENIQPSFKAHSHSPDEPQSYKQGEDVQKNAESQNILNVPVALAMNGNSQIQNEPHNVNNVIQSVQNSNKETVVNNNNVGNIVNNIVNNGAINNNNFDNDLKHNINDPVAPRLKREAVDCSNADKKKSDTLLIKTNYKEESEEHLKNVDLNDLGLPKNLPLQNNILVYHMRSLKTYDEIDKDR